MNEFLKDGKLMLGINYWASENAINMWSEWNPDVIEKDFQLIKNAGLDYLRVFPLWSVFQPLCEINNHDGVLDYRFGEDSRPETEAGRAGVSEDACLNFEEMCRIADKYDLKLITGHMSGRFFAPPAFSTKNPITDYTAIKWEIRFVKYFVSRFKDKKCIVGWDLGNEVSVFADKYLVDSAYLWCTAITNTVKTCDPDRPVITGVAEVPLVKDEFNIRDIGEIIDIHTVHSYNIFDDTDPIISMRSIFRTAHDCQLYSDVGKVPTFVQEIGSIGYTNCSEKTEAEFYRALLFSSLAHNSLGVMWWCAFDQGTMEYLPYDFNNIGSDYGFFRIDGSEKPIVKVNRKFAELMKQMPFDSLPKAETEAVCMIQRCGTSVDSLLKNTHCLAEQANINLSFAYVEDEIPDSPLYILPSVDNYGQAISFHKLKEILSKVKKGASFYISLGNGFFRNTPEYSGMKLAYKEKMTHPEKVNIGGNTLEIMSDFKYTVEECNSEILATGEDGRPVFVKNKYGDGYIYFRTLAVEKYLKNRIDIFSDADSPDYSVWYKELKKEIPDNRVIETDKPIACVTEHITDSENRYAIIINYSRDHIKTKLSIKADWIIDEIFYGEVKDNIASIDRGDAVILKLKKVN